MKGRVTIFYKDSIFDPQGNTLAKSLKGIGFETVKDVRVGKVIDVEINTESEDDLKAQLEQMCQKLLANPVIESYRYEVC